MSNRLLAVLVLGAVACSAQPGPGKFEKFASSDAGQKRIAAWVSTPNNPIDQRVDALVAVAAAGFPGKIRGMLDTAKDREDLAEKTASALADRLAKAGSDPEAIAPLREAVLGALTYVPDARKAPIQKTVADWAFAGLTLDSTDAVVKAQIEPRIEPMQMQALGAAGTAGAAILVRHGFDVVRMSQYILSIPDPAAHLRLLEAFRKLHATPDMAIPLPQLELVGKIKNARAATYLLDLSMDPNQESDVRAAAFNEAARLMDDPAIRAGDLEGILARLDKMAASQEPDDRWSGANYLLVVQGLEAMPRVMAGLKDDGIYPNATEDPMKSMVDFCKSTLFKVAKGPEVWPAVQGLLKSRNRVHQALGIICTKASEDPTKALLVAPLTGSSANLLPVLGNKMTLGALATNAKEGLQMYAEVAADVAAKRMDEADAKLMRFAILVDLTETGRVYRKAVADRFKEDRK
jgi:hypothetical protein